MNLEDNWYTDIINANTYAIDFHLIGFDIFKKIYGDSLMNTFPFEKAPLLVVEDKIFINSNFIGYEALKEMVIYAQGISNADIEYTVDVNKSKEFVSPLMTLANIVLLAERNRRANELVKK